MKHLLSINDLSKAEAINVLDTAAELTRLGGHVAFEIARDSIQIEEQFEPIAELRPHLLREAG